MGELTESPLDTCDLAWLYEDRCAKALEGTKIVIQATQEIQALSELFYAPVLVNHSMELKGMLDSGSMPCTVASVIFPLEKLSSVGVLREKKHPEDNVVLIGCGIKT